MSQDEVERDEATEWLLILSRIFAFENYNDIKSDAVARELGASQPKVAGLMKAVLTDPDAWEDIKKTYGCAEEQRPPWVGKGKEEATALKSVSNTEAREVVNVEAPGSRKSPIVDTTVLVQENTQNGGGAGGVGGSCGAPSAQETAFQAVNRALVAVVSTSSRSVESLFRTGSRGAGSPR